jgi:hypothetical protein
MIRKLDDSGIQMVDLWLVVEWSNIWTAFKNRTNLSGFGMVPTSLDRFILKRVIKIIFFCIKRSRLEIKKLLVQFLKAFKPFKNQAQKVSEKWPLEYRTVRYYYLSDWNSPTKLITALTWNISNGWPLASDKYKQVIAFIIILKL